MAKKRDALMIEIKGGGGGAVENLYNELGFGYVIDNEYFETLANDSYEITSGWTSYISSGQTSGKLMSFIPDLPVTTNNMSFMFQNCYRLQTIPQLNTSNVMHGSYMFYGCSSLQSVPLLDLSKINILQGMFQSCTSLQSVPLLDLSKATNISYMFQSCTNLQSVPHFNTSNVTDMSYIFQDCTSLQTIPQFNTSKVTNPKAMMSGCSGLKSLPKLNFSSVSQSMIYSTSFLKGNSSSTAATNNYPMLTDLEGFTGLKITFWLNACQSLTEQSIINVFNEMADLTGQTAQTVHLGNVNIAKCSPETLEIATNKNWLIQ